VRALGTIREPWAQDILVSALDDPLPDYVKTECEQAIEALRQEGIHT